MLRSALKMIFREMLIEEKGGGVLAKKWAKFEAGERVGVAEGEKGGKF